MFAVVLLHQQQTLPCVEDTMYGFMQSHVNEMILQCYRLEKDAERFCPRSEFENCFSVKFPSTVALLGLSAL